MDTSIIFDMYRIREFGLQARLSKGERLLADDEIRVREIIR